MSFRVVRMTREKEECFALLPRLSEAMLEFGVQFEQHGATAMYRRFEASFIMEDSNAAAWLGLEGNTLRGHFVAFVEPILDKPVAHVQQLQIDSHHVPQWARDQVLNEFEQWARDRGCKRTEQGGGGDIPRLWKRFGFERWRAVYKKTL